MRYATKTMEVALSKQELAVENLFNWFEYNLQSRFSLSVSDTKMTSFSVAEAGENYGYGEVRGGYLVLAISQNIIQKGHQVKEIVKI